MWNLSACFNLVTLGKLILKHGNCKFYIYIYFGEIRCMNSKYNSPPPILLSYFVSAFVCGLQ
jgi:hypothetical protein